MTAQNCSAKKRDPPRFEADAAANGAVEPQSHCCMMVLDMLFKVLWGRRSVQLRHMLVEPTTNSIICSSTIRTSSGEFLSESKVLIHKLYEAQTVRGRDGQQRLELAYHSVFPLRAVPWAELTAHTVKLIVYILLTIVCASTLRVWSPVSFLDSSYATA